MQIEVRELVSDNGFFHVQSPRKDLPAIHSDGEQPYKDEKFFQFDPILFFLSYKLMTLLFLS